jgi:hypothetical protein
MAILPLVANSHFVFAGVPAVSAAPLPCGMMPLAANLHAEENTLVCAFIAAWL